KRDSNSPWLKRSRQVKRGCAPLPLCASCPSPGPRIDPLCPHAGKRFPRGKKFDAAHTLERARRSRKRESSLRLCGSNRATGNNAGASKSTNRHMVKTERTRRWGRDVSNTSIGTTRLMPAASGFDRRGKASWPMRLVIALLFFTIFASRCFAFGAYAVGYDAKRNQFASFLILNRSTAQEAEDIALRACQNKSFTECAIKYTFSNTCIAIAFTRNRLIRFIDTDPSLEYARTKVMTACESSPGIKCF